MNEALVWIVIPTWNRCDDLKELLISIKSLAYNHIKVLVVDNGSDDNTILMLKENFPKIQYIQLNKNVGAARAANVGFEYALNQQAELVLRLDSDTILDKYFLTHLVHASQIHKDAGVFVGKIFYHANPQIIWSMGAFQKSWSLGAREIARDKHDSTILNQDVEVDYAWCTGMLFTRSALVTTKGFDSDFFVYFEEAELCCRLHTLGFEIWSIPKAKMWHKVGQISRSPSVSYQWARSKMLFYRKQTKCLHKASLIFYAYIYAIIHWLLPLQSPGNRGPIKPALKGLTKGLIYPL